MATRADWVNWYKQFCLEEYDVEEDITEEQTEFPVMYSTFEHCNWSSGEYIDEEDEHDIQLTYYTEPMQMVVYVDGKAVYTEQLKDYDDMLNDVQYCTFQAFYDWATDMADIEYNKALKGEQK